MLRTNPKNDRVKREYLIYLKDARQRSVATVDQVRYAIDRLEVYTGFKDFGTFNKEQALGFKRALVVTKGQRSASQLVLQPHITSCRRSKNFWCGCTSGLATAAGSILLTSPT